MDIAAPLRHATAVAATALLAACATTADETTMEVPGGEDAPDAMFVVEANVDNVEDATVWLVPETGVRMRIGDMTGDQQDTFTVDELPTSNSFTLVADYGAEEVVSREFTLSEGDVVTWDLNLNRVFFGGEAGGA